MSDASPASAPRLERTLAFMVAGIVALSFACFLAIIIGTAVGLDRDDFASGAWPVVALVPLFGLPLGTVLIIVLLIVSAVRRGRAARSADE